MATDSRRLDVVLDGFPCSGVVNWPSTPLWCPNRDGVVLEAVRRSQECRLPELVGPRSRARLVVLAVEVGGRWSAEPVPSWHKETPLLRMHSKHGGCDGQAFACAAAKAVASSLLELKVSHGADGTPLLVLRCPNHRHEWVGALILVFSPQLDVTHFPHFINNVKKHFFTTFLHFSTCFHLHFLIFIFTSQAKSHSGRSFSTWARPT